MTWTHFHDMHSGGGQKLDWAHIFIEAPEAEAKVIFYKRFGRNPERVTCTCCGEDYSISESSTIEEATAYQRNCRWAEDARGWMGRDRPLDYKDGCYLEPGNPVPAGMRVGERFHAKGDGITVEEYFGKPRKGGLFDGTCLRINAVEIKPEERVGFVPEEGYVWAGDDD